MLAYNLMNLFKELVLGQKRKKRMGKWIRQRFFLIAVKLIRGGRKFILKLQEDWAYRGRSIMRQREGLWDWLGLHKRKGKNVKETKEKSHSMERFVQLIEKVWELSYFRLKVEARVPFFLWRWVFREKILLDKRLPS